MDMSIEKMLSHVYEIEGLMLVTRRLGEENTPDVITNKIQRKVRELAEMCGIDLTNEAPAADEAPAAVDTPADGATAAASEQHLPEDDYDADETWQHDNGEEFKEVFTLEYEEPKHEVVDPMQVPVEDREPDDDITVEFIDAPDEPAAAEPAPAPAAPDEEVTRVLKSAEAATPVPPVFRMPEENDEPVPEPDPAVLPEADDAPDIEVEFIEADDGSLPEPEDEMPIPPVPTEFPEPEEPAAPMRVDEKLQRTMSKDIRKAFSLNDRFRFQRELFAGSADAMNTAIEHIEAMRSYGNAELYFFSQLHWDRENEVVQDFMNIVRNHFSK